MLFNAVIVLQLWLTSVLELPATPIRTSAAFTFMCFATEGLPRQPKNVMKCADLRPGHMHADINTVPNGAQAPAPVCFQLGLNHSQLSWAGTSHVYWGALAHQFIVNSSRACQRTLQMWREREGERTRERTGKVKKEVKACKAKMTPVQGFNDMALWLIVVLFIVVKQTLKLRDIVI